MVCYLLLQERLSVHDLKCIVPDNMLIRLQEITICASTLNFKPVGIVKDAPMTSDGHRVKIFCPSFRGTTSMDNIHDAAKGTVTCNADSVLLIERRLHLTSRKPSTVALDNCLGKSYFQLIKRTH